MPIRTIKRELEAKLKGPGGGFFSNPGGKVERKSYGDGVERLREVAGLNNIATAVPVTASLVFELQ